jgi:nucleoid-associated protein YgaU
MPDQEMKQQEEQEPLAPQANAAARAPDTEAGPEAEEIETEATSEAKEEDELTPEERGLQMIRKHQQAYRQRIEDAKARIRTRAEWRRIKRLGQTYRYTVQPGDTLETVAKIFYAKPERWPEIYEANAGRVPEPGDEGPQPLEPGTELVIP